jgi:hypothetical protein
MTWSSLNKKRKRARQTYEFIPRHGVRCILIRTNLSILYSQRTLQPCTTKFKNSNTHVRKISLPPTKRRATRQREIIDSDNAKSSDRSNDHDYAYASDNANDGTRREMLM